jgi:shikimate kinase
MIITLIGMPGAGKSSVGKRLARLLGYTFTDTDDLIIHAAGTMLQDIVDEKGDMGLIGIEEQCILSLELQDDCIIATGGSVVYSDRSMAFLRSNSTIIFLDVPYETIARRLSNIDTRGVVGLKGRGLRELYQERTGLYAAYADMTIRVTGRDRVQDVVNRITERMQAREA